MTIHKANPETHQTCRSLLQKAVRRGGISLIPKVVTHLNEVGDFDWLRNRVGVITYEECWPLGTCLPAKPNVEEIIQTLIEVALCVKQKDAAGLGALAYELSKGDSSVVSNPSADRPIRIIAEAIKKPKEFWEWIEKETGIEQSQLIESAHSTFKHGGWPWDRAFMQAAALLAITQGIPTVTKISSPACSERDFPFWAAIDKHTEEGKKIIRIAAEKSGQNARKIGWLFFYFASAVENELAPSFWWKREMEWRLRKIGSSLSQAESNWKSIYPIIREIMSESEENLKTHISAEIEVELAPKQLSLF